MHIKFTALQVGWGGGGVNSWKQVLWLNLKTNNQTKNTESKYPWISLPIHGRTSWYSIRVRIAEFMLIPPHRLHYARVNLETFWFTCPVSAKTFREEKAAYSGPLYFRCMEECIAIQVKCSLSHCPSRTFTYKTRPDYIEPRKIVVIKGKSRPD